jgi:regulation of enolase protein 1 (concanavalin A-like superfamily)
MKNNLKYNIGDKVTPDASATVKDTWLYDYIGKTATVDTVGIGWFKVIFDDTGLIVTMSDDKWQHTSAHTTQEK